MSRNGGTISSTLRGGGRCPDRRGDRTKGKLSRPLFHVDLDSSGDFSVTVTLLDRLSPPSLLARRVAVASSWIASIVGFVSNQRNGWFRKIRRGRDVSSNNNSNNNKAREGKSPTRRRIESGEGRVPRPFHGLV